jgi:hypothetical protein
VSVPPELRITDAEIRELREHGEHAACPTCDGASFYWFGAPGDCAGCGGWGHVEIRNLPRGATARLGAMLLDRLPHLRHRNPPEWTRFGEVPRKLDRGALGMALAMVASVGGGR